MSLPRWHSHADSKAVEQPVFRDLAAGLVPNQLPNFRVEYFQEQGNQRRVFSPKKVIIVSFLRGSV